MRSRIALRTCRPAALGVSILAMAMVATVVVVAGPARPAGSIAPCTDPPTVFPIERLERGMRATGWTVVEGTEPVPFSVEILGVQPDAIAPDFDVIVVKASGPVIDQAGGIAAGFSGSPVYRRGKLLGSLSWTTDDPRYGAITPGAYLIDLLQMPSAVQAAGRIGLDPGIRSAIADDAGVAASAAPTALTQIPMPLAVSGISGPRLAEIEADFEASGVPVVAYRTGAASASPRIVTTDPVQPGDAIAAAISFGTVTYAGVGTVTIACGDVVVAFGHYFIHMGGGISSALLTAEIVTTVPSDYPFKLANIGELIGRVDQDRFVGIRGVIGVAPPLVALRTQAESLDTGMLLTGVTQLAPAADLWLWEEHVYAVIHRVLDTDRGTVDIAWTIEGLVDGRPFSARMHNVYTGDEALWSSSGDVSGSAYSLERAGRNVAIRAMRSTVTVREDERLAEAHHPRTWSTTEPTFAVRGSIDVRPGDTLLVRVPIVVRSTGAVVFAESRFVVPATVTGDGHLQVVVGHPRYWIEGTWDEVLFRLTKQPAANVLYIRLSMKGMDQISIRFIEPWVLIGEPRDASVRLLR